jgi:uncharacterized protein YbaA (DUF1428 family)
MYVDGFIVPVPRKKIADYLKIARKCGKIWKEHGALEYRECVADDVKPGKWTSFPQSVKLKKDEAVIFSWIVYRSKAARNSVMKKVMSDARMKPMMNMNMMPFDGKRVIYGGFKLRVDL